MWITPVDLEPFAIIDPAKAAAMIEDVEASALVAAPGLNDPLKPLTADQTAAVKAVLRQAILRWNDAGSGALTQETMGPYSSTVDTRQRRFGGLLDSEMTQLRTIVAATARRVFTVKAYDPTSPHTPWCNLNLGATYCSCGADLTNYAYPLYELG